MWQLPKHKTFHAIIFLSNIQVQEVCVYYLRGTQQLTPRFVNVLSLDEASPSALMEFINVFYNVIICAFAKYSCKTKSKAFGDAKRIQHTFKKKEQA